MKGLRVCVIFKKILINSFDIFRGQKGQKGEQGLKGIMGITGDKGDKGEIGPQGYCILKSDYFCLTLREIFLFFSPQGFKGDLGPIGLTGIQGVKGDKVIFILSVSYI